MKVVNKRGLFLVGWLGLSLLSPMASRAQEAAPQAEPEDLIQPEMPKEDADPHADAPVLPAPAAAYNAPPVGAQDRAVAPQVTVEEQRAAFRRQEKANLENRLRSLMTAMGIPEVATQDALITYLSEDEKARNEVRDASRRLMVGLRREASPDRMKDLISAYKNSLENEKIRRRAAQASLDAKIGYSNNPRLEALLWVVGVLGEGSTGIPMYQAANRGPGPRPNSPTYTARVAAQAVAQPAGDAAATTEFVTGVIESKTVDYIELRDDAGHVERYFPRANSAPALVAPGLEKVSLNDFQQLAVGQRVRLEWNQQDVRRIVNVRPLPAPLQATAATLATPETP